MKIMNFFMPVLAANFLNCANYLCNLRRRRLEFCRMLSRWLPVSVIILAFALAADAHPVPFSYLDVQLHGASIDLSLTVHIYDLAHDLQVAPMERLLDPAFLKQRESAIQQLFAPRLAIYADDRLLSPEWQQAE